MNIFFTADTHFYHKKVIEYCKRPFKDIEEMNEVLIENWNGVVKTKDTVYHLGDFSFGNRELIRKLRYRLRGKIILILGNHDIRGRIHKLEDLFTEITLYKELNINKKRFILFHYPILEWNHYFRGAFHLYGHTHKDMKLKNALNVGVDLHDYRPISLEEILKILGGKIQNG